jgi:hypothetical protein
MKQSQWKESGESFLMGCRVLQIGHLHWRKPEIMTKYIFHKVIAASVLITQSLEFIW